MALVFRDAETLSERNFEVCTEVTFAELSEDIIEAYIQSREPLWVKENCVYMWLYNIFISRDKAGAYPSIYY